MFVLKQKINVSATPQLQTVRLKISGMHCTSCSMNIDGELEDSPGVSNAATSYATAISLVHFDPTQITVPKIQSIIAGLGYETTILEPV